MLRSVLKPQNTVAFVAFCIVAVVCSQAQTWTVREYGDPNNPWTSEDPNAHPCGCIAVSGSPDFAIRITANPTRELKFEIYYADPNGVYQSEAPLNDFTIDNAVDAELIQIRIARDPAASDPSHKGASDIAQMNIAPGNFDECRLTGLEVSGNLATVDKVICDNVTGAITVEKDLEGTLRADTLGNLTIEGEFAGIAVPGDIVIAQDYAGTLAINNRYSGTITLGDPNDPNDPNKAADLSGTISTGIFLSDAQIRVTGDVDLADLAALLGTYGACEGDPYYNPNADFDGSGCVEASDLLSLLRNYGMTA